MAEGVSTFTSNGWLNTIKSTGTSFNVAGPVFVGLATGAPTSTGQATLSSTTVRLTCTFGTSTTGQLVSNMSPSWTNWAGSNGEVVKNVTFWDTIQGTAGNFLWSASLSAAKTINTGDTFTLTTATLTITTAS
jgi:hypothetical protein